MGISRVNGLPSNGIQYKGQDYYAAILSNQYGIAGSTGLQSPYHGDERASVFIEYVYADGVFNILDKNGVAVFTGMPALLDLARAPLRIDGGFSLTGANFALVKGFILRG